MLILLLSIFCWGGHAFGDVCWNSWLPSWVTGHRDPRDKPNFVLFFADDMGYGDLASYGHPTQERGPIDDVMIDGGLRFSQAYVPDTVCTPSRTALLTGRLPVRIGIFGTSRVFLPWTRTGLPREELTLPEALKQRGYTTGMVGKWHLGINAETRDDGYHLPTHHGFDVVGHFLPFTNSLDCDDTGRIKDFPNIEKCILMRDTNTIVAQPYNHTYLTQTFVNDAVNFIEDNADDPFFFYFPLAHPHTSLFAGPDFAGKSARGEYGDNMNEMSWAVGEVIRALEDNCIAENTLVLFISDHGPHAEYCAHGGDHSIFKGYKSTSWEGGVRVPLVAYWPDTISPGRESNEVISTLDIMKTLVDLAGGTLPSNVTYDGEVITDVLLAEATSPHDVLYFYCKDRLMAVRSGPYKVHYHTQRVRTQDYLAEECAEGGIPTHHYFDCGECYGDCVTDHDPPLVYDVEVDPTESYPLNTTDADIAQFLSEIGPIVQAHIDSVVPVDPLLSDKDPDHSNVPCCDSSTNCICNFGPVDGPYSQRSG